MTTEKNSPVSLTEEEYEDHTEAYDGLCLSCHSWTDGGVEPDAEEYTCEDCGQDAVCGAEQAMLLGKLEIVGDDNE